MRFEPDSWLEGLLRPFILADPHGFIYYEAPAPDLRFAVLGVLTLLVAAVGRWRNDLGAPVWRTLLGFWLIFYVWTFVTGNGRYFAAGLLLAGTLIVVLLARLPVTASMRALLLLGLLGLQGMVVHNHFRHGMWSLVTWREGTGLPLGESSLRKEPAIFVTISSISHSILVPQFHPLSRWANVTGQADIEPGMPEYAPLRELLATPLPKYLVLQIISEVPEAGLQPRGAVLEMIQTTLARHGLERDGRPCQALRSHVMQQDMSKGGPSNLPLAYWFCPLRVGAPAAPVLPPRADRWDDVFDAVERRCPRFFPPGSGKVRFVGDLVLRSYNAADTRVMIESTGQVFFRHERSLNPTLIGQADQVRRGDFTIDCHKLPGRYVYPWQRD